MMTNYFRRTFTPLRCLCVFVPAAVLGTILGRLHGISDLAGVAGAVLAIVGSAFLVFAFQAVTAETRGYVTMNVDDKTYTMPDHRLTH